MNFLELISKKKERIEECNIQIRALQKSYKNKIYQQDKDKLIAFIRQKKELFKSLSAEDDPNEFTKKLDTLDEKIYRQYLVFRQIIRDNQDFTKDSTNNFNKAFNNFDLNRLGNLNYDIFSKIFLFSKDHPLISIFIFYVFGGGLFAYYFYFHLEYFPKINKESFLYSSLAIMSSMSLIAIVIGFIIAIILSISKETFKYANFYISTILIVVSTFVLWTLYRYPHKELFYYYMFAIFIAMVIFIVSHILIRINYIFSGYFYKLRFIRFIANLMAAIIASLVSIFPAILLVLLIKEISPTSDLVLTFLTFAIDILFIIRHKSIIIFLSIVGSLLAGSYFLPLAIGFAGFGNYTVETLVVDSKAYIPKESFDLIKDSGNFIIPNPKILSNVGEDYLIELKGKDNNFHRFTIPKNLVKSQVIPIPNKEENQPDKSDKKTLFQLFLQALQ